MIKKTTEIDAILLNLNKAIDAHYQWLVSMFHSVVARDASKPEITDNHSYGLCQFGRWIDHLGPLDNDELPYVRLMDSAHQHMHNCGRELMLAIVENHWQDAHFDAFQEGLLIPHRQFEKPFFLRLIWRISPGPLNMALPGARHIRLPGLLLMMHSPTAAVQV